MGSRQRTGRCRDGRRVPAGHAGTDWALATTGEAGPESGEGQPVGTLFVALAGPNEGEPVVERHFMPTDREAFKHRASQAALDLLRRTLEK